MRRFLPAPLVPLLLAALLLAAWAAAAAAAPARQPEPTAGLLPERPTLPPAATSAPTDAPAPDAPGAPAQAATATAAPELSLEISKTLLGSDVVQVGQYLTFTVQITNTGLLPVTELPLVDEYETSILEPDPGRAEPPPSSAGPGLLRWDDLTEQFGDLPPGGSVTVTVVFRAIRIDDEVINRVRVETGLGSGGEGGGSAEDEASGEVEGGRVVVEKALVESFVRLDTPVISFTLSLRNDGYADIVSAPFVDTYDTTLLQFISASVPPDSHNPATGELRWDDLLVGLGLERLGPQEQISFTTIFSVTGAIEDAVVNSADAVGVVDEFGNEVYSPNRAEVRIRIGGPGGGDTPTPAEPDAPAEPDEPGATATPATPRPTGTPLVGRGPTTAAGAPTAAPAEATSATAEASAGATQPAGGAAAPRPATLPATGAADRSLGFGGLVLLAIVAGAVLLAAGRGRRP